MLSYEQALIGLSTLQLQFSRSLQTGEIPFCVVLLDGRFKIWRFCDHVVRL